MFGLILLILILALDIRILNKSLLIVLYYFNHGLPKLLNIHDLQAFLVVINHLVFLYYKNSIMENFDNIMEHADDFFFIFHWTIIVSLFPHIDTRKDVYNDQEENILKEKEYPDFAFGYPE